MSIPISNKNLSTSTCPCSAAKCKALRPIWSRASNEASKSNNKRIVSLEAERQFCDLRLCAQGNPSGMMYIALQVTKPTKKHENKRNTRKLIRLTQRSQHPGLKKKARSLVVPDGKPYAVGSNQSPVVGSPY